MQYSVKTMLKLKWICWLYFKNAFKYCSQDKSKVCCTDEALALQCAVLRRLAVYFTGRGLLYGNASILCHIFDENLYYIYEIKYLKH